METPQSVDLSRLPEPLRRAAEALGAAPPADVPSEAPAKAPAAPPIGVDLSALERDEPVVVAPASDEPANFMDQRFAGRNSAPEPSTTEPVEPAPVEPEPSTTEPVDPAPVERPTVRTFDQTTGKGCADFLATVAKDLTDRARVARLGPVERARAAAGNDEPLDDGVPEDLEAKDRLLGGARQQITAADALERAARSVDARLLGVEQSSDPQEDVRTAMRLIYERLTAALPEVRAGSFGSQILVGTITSVIRFASSDAHARAFGDRA